MSMPEDAAQDVYKNTFYYKNIKTGKIKEFSEKNYPWQDTLNWEYYDMESVLVKEGYHPPIHDFQIETADGENMIDFFIYDENYVFMLVAYDLNKSDTKSQGSINTLANWALEKGYSFVGLTSTILEDATEFAEKWEAPYEFFNCDEITLKTMIRSNPGLFVLKNGTILGKWHHNDIPTPDEFTEIFLKE
jgi:hypothetical protein